MRSVADDLRADSYAFVRSLSPDERLALVLRLGEEDLSLFCQAQGIGRDEAIRLIQRQRQQGRTFSRCVDSLLS